MIRNWLFILNNVAEESVFASAVFNSLFQRTRDADVERGIIYRLRSTGGKTRLTGWLPADKI